MTVYIENVLGKRLLDFAYDATIPVKGDIIRIGKDAYEVRRNEYFYDVDGKLGVIKIVVGIALPPGAPIV